MDYIHKTKPYDHQRDEFNAHRESRSRGLWWEMGCVDAETEFLSPKGWIPIRDHAGEHVAQWDPSTGEASWTAAEHVRMPATEFLHVNGARGVDMMICRDHKVPTLTKRGDRWAGDLSGRELANRLRCGLQIRIPSTFTLTPIGPGLGLSAEDLRLQIAVMADGSFPAHSPHTRRCVVRLKRPCKIERLRELLQGREGVHVREEPSTGFTVFAFDAPWRLKTYRPEWVGLVSAADRDVILDEVFHWDGDPVRRIYRSAHRSDVDFIQFLAASAGLVAGVRQSKCWELHVRQVRTNGYVLTEKNLHTAPAVDGLRYCFTTPAGYWIARRNGTIFPTGNCGKTKPTIDTMAWLYRAGLIKGVLIVAPKAVAPNWARDELAAHLPDDVMRETRVVLWQTNKAGTQKYQCELNEALRHEGLVIVCMSYSGLMTQKKTGAKRIGKLRRTYKGHELAKELLESRPCMMVLDESARIKEPGSKRTKRVQAVATRAKYRRVLTGTPIANAPFDVYSQVLFLDPFFWARHGCRGWPAFKNTYGVFVKRLQNPSACPHARHCPSNCGSTDVASRPNGTRRCRSCGAIGPDEHPKDDYCDCPKFDMLVEYKNLESLQRVVAEVGSRLLKDDVLDLPPKSYSLRYFDLTPGQWKLYETLRTKFMVALENGDMITAPLVITNMLRLQQITSGYCPTDDGAVLREPKNPRVDVLAEVVEDCPHKLIIWAKFQDDFDQIGDRLRQMGVEFVEYTGRTKDVDREHARTAFQNDPAIKVFLGNPSCAGEGLTLHAARTVVYYNTSYKLADRLQSEDRAHRIGQQHPVQYIDLVAQGTIDEKVLQALRDKKDLADLVMGDPTGRWL